MTDASKNIIEPQQATGVISVAITNTPKWVLGFAGGMVTLSVCLIAVMQLGGFSAPMQRILNAKATEIERAAVSISGSAEKLDAALTKIGDIDSRVTALEARVDKVDRYHRVLGVKP